VIDDRRVFIFLDRELVLVHVAVDLDGGVGSRAIVAAGGVEDLLERDGARGVNPDRDVAEILASIGVFAN